MEVTVVARQPLPAEGDEEQPEHVIGGQTRRDQRQHPEPELGSGRAQGRPDDLVLAEEAGEQREAADGERAEQERPERNRQAGPQIPHVPDVLVIVKRVDHIAGGQE